jgi:hypothetical protein
MTSLVDPARLRELFDSLATTIDASSDDTEPVIERATIVSMLDKHVSAEGGERDAIARQLFGILDDDGDGIVTFEEFCLAYDVHPLEMVRLRLRLHFAFCVLSHLVHAAIVEVPDLPSLKCSSLWSPGLYPASVEEEMVRVYPIDVALDLPHKSPMMPP